MGPIGLPPDILVMSRHVNRTEAGRTLWVATGEAKLPDVCSVLENMFFPLWEPGKMDTI